MSSNHGRHDFNGYLKSIPFEVGRAFYPPPNIPLPDMNIPPPSDFKYDFKREWQAIELYKLEQSKDSVSPITDGIQVPKPSAIDIISKVSYLSIASSKKPPVAAVNIPTTINGSVASSASSTPLLTGPNNFTPTSAANLLPSYSYPQLL